MFDYLINSSFWLAGVRVPLVPRRLTGPPSLTRSSWWRVLLKSLSLRLIVIRLSCSWNFLFWIIDEPASEPIYVSTTWYYSRSSYALLWLLCRRWSGFMPGLIAKAEFTPIVVSGMDRTVTPPLFMCSFGVIIIFIVFISSSLGDLGEDRFAVMMFVCVRISCDASCEESLRIIIICCIWLLCLISAFLF